MTIVESEAAVIRRIFTEYAVEGRSQREITRRLNRDGIQAQRGAWTQGSLSKTLRSPTYCGLVAINGETYSGTHEPIVDEALWRKAQQLAEANTRTRRSRTPTANHLLAGGLLRCGRCGRSMYASTRPQRGNGVTWEAYSCSSRAQHGLDACDQTPVKRKPIDEAIWRFVTEAALDLDATRRAIVEEMDAKLRELVALRDQAEREAQRAQDRLIRVRSHYQDGKIDPDDWREQREQLTAELEAATAQVDQFEQQREALTAESAGIDVESAVLRELTALKESIMGEAREGSREGVEAFRATLKRLFDRFELVAWPGYGVSPSTPTGSIAWPDGLTVGESRLVIIPHVKADAVDLSAGWFPALPKTALALRGTDSKVLPNNYPSSGGSPVSASPSERDRVTKIPQFAGRRWLVYGFSPMYARWTVRNV